LGGLVDKSPKGWGVGINTYELLDAELTQDGDGAHLQLLASHQDQVMHLPPGAKAIAQNDHCELAGMKIGQHILTFQGHPEFIHDYSREIMTFRHALIGEERVAEGMASLDKEHQGQRVARWMLAFIRGAR